MSGRHNLHKWSDLRERFLNDPDYGEERRRAVEELSHAYDALLALHELRQATDTTQAEVARGMGVSQPYVAKLERRGEMSITTLASYLAALGGHLEVRAVFPDHPEDNVALALPSTTSEPSEPSEPSGASEASEASEARRTTVVSEESAK